MSSSEPLRESNVVLGRMIGAIVGSVLLLFAYEWEYYRRMLQWGTLPISTWDRVVLLWILFAKTMWPLFLLLAASSLLRRAGQAWLASALWLIGSGGVFLWLVFDLSVQALTNNHLRTYVPFLFDPTTWQWAGGAGGILIKVIAAALMVGVGVVIADRATERLVAKCVSRWQCLGQSRGVSLLWLFLFLLAFGVVPAHRGASCHLAIDRLRATLPWDPLAMIADGGAGDSDAERSRIDLDRQLQKSLVRQIESLRRPGPTDGQTVALRQSPHLVLFVLESLRNDVWSRGMMPRIATWARQGLQLDRHYAGANCSHLGVFGLLYARSTLLYHSTLDARTPPQCCTTLRAAGYECSYFASSTLDWMRMNEFARLGPFDRVVTDERPDWVAGDRAILAQVRNQLRQAKQPQFILCFLDSTHYPYLYPVEFAKYGPVIPPDVVPTIKNRAETHNRYMNAALFIDHELAETISTLDPLRHLIIVTGDHGESHFDDGALSHSRLLSDIQCRTPLAIVGPGVPQSRIAQATTHADLLPTLLHVLAEKHVRLANTQGRDLLAGPVDDQSLIATTNDSSWEAVLIHGDRRLSLRISLREPTVRSLGYLDVHGKFDPCQTVGIQDVDAWAALVDEQFSHLAGTGRRVPEGITGRASSVPGLRR